MNFQMFKLNLEKAEEPEIKLPTYVGSSKKREFQKNIYSVLLTLPKPLIVWVTTNQKILKEMEIYHLICFLRNLYGGWEATVRTEYRTTDWFQIGKGVVKAVYCHPAYLTYIQVSCIVVRCFTVWTTSESLYADYIMRNSGQDEAQARIKIA